MGYNIVLTECKWSSLNAPGTETPQSHPYWKLGEFSFLSIGLLPYGPIERLFFGCVNSPQTAAADGKSLLAYR